MKNLTEVVLKEYKSNIQSTPFFISAKEYLEFKNDVSKYVPDTNKSIKAYKSIEEMNRSVKTLQQLIIIVESSNEDESLLEKGSVILSKTSLVAIVDIYETIKKRGEGLDLSNYKLKGAQLKGAKLSGSNLTGTDLRGADLERSDLTNTTLSEANLEGANLSFAKLTGANMRLADLRRANLKYSDARNTQWDRTAMRGIELWGSYLWEADLSNAFSNSVDLSRADLRGNKSVRD